MKQYIAVALLLVGCAGLTPTQKFEQGIRGYETALQGAITYYDPDGDGITDRAITEKERRLVQSLIVSGRSIRNSGIDVVLECRREMVVSKKDTCSGAVYLKHGASSLSQISKDLSAIHFGEWYR